MSAKMCQNTTHFDFFRSGGGDRDRWEATFGLLEDRPDTVDRILVHSAVSTEISRKLRVLCHRHGIPLVGNDKTIEKICEKDNCLAVGAFREFEGRLTRRGNHVVQVNVKPY